MASAVPPAAHPPPSYPVRRCSPPPPPSSLRRRFSSKSTKKEASFTDQLLDYIEGGPKLRRWYGAPDLLPKDGSTPAPDNDEPPDAVLVTDGDSEVGELVILSLILQRSPVKAIVKDPRAAAAAFGSYIDPIAARPNGRLSPEAALRGVRAIVCPCNEGFLSAFGQLSGVRHVVLLSQAAAYRGCEGVRSLLTAKARKLAERDEETVIGSGIPYTIIRIGLLEDGPGGGEGFRFGDGVAAKGRLRKEDAARLCVAALQAVPANGVVVEVANGDDKVADWNEWFASFGKEEGAS